MAGAGEFRAPAPFSSPFSQLAGPLGDSVLNLLLRSTFVVEISTMKVVRAEISILALATLPYLVSATCYDIGGNL
jgi:hypothetical protein